MSSNEARQTLRQRQRQTTNMAGCMCYTAGKLKCWCSHAHKSGCDCESSACTSHVHTVRFYPTVHALTGSLSTVTKVDRHEEMGVESGHSIVRW